MAEAGEISMPDYIYLLEHRLSSEQQSALRHLRDAAKEAEMILFLTGDAVRDLTSGHAVRDIEVTVHGSALNLKNRIIKAGGSVWGEDEATQSLYLCFPGTVRVDLISAHRVEFPKPGQPVIHPASIQEDLRRRDFTVNAMAISLNEGSFGLLMDPLNGAADIEARTLRLVSNYGFIEDPSLLIRATRYRTRLGWELDPKSQTRYENAKGDGAIEYLSEKASRQELEQIGHEDDGLKVLQALDAEGWMKVLFPAWTPAKADEEKLKALHDLAVELLVQGVRSDVSAAQMQLLTAKLGTKELAALKKQLLRPGFVEEWNSLDALAAGFAKALHSKDNQTPSASFKLFTSYDPEAVLWLGFTSKDAGVKDRFNLFLKVWPETRLRIPYALMQEMRIKPELPTYNEIVHSIFLELIDGRLGTPEEMRAFLEPHSPPAPPPQVTIKRTRAKRGAEKAKDYDDDEEAEDSLDSDEDIDDMGGDDDDIGIGLGLPKVDLEPDVADEIEPDEADEEEEEAEGDHEPEPPSVKRGPKGSAGTKTSKDKSAGKAHAGGGKTPAAAKPETAAKSHPVHKAEPEAKHAAKPAAKSSPAPAKAAATHSHAKPAPPGRAVATAAKKAGPAAHGSGKHEAAKPAAKKAAHKPPVKPATKAVAKAREKGRPAKAGPAKSHSVHAKAAKAKPHHPAKAAHKKPAGKPAKKR
jgi:tRNA nucleotidyltransferase (CCA-adding enzyme)